MTRRAAFAFAVAAALGLTVGLPAVAKNKPAESAAASQSDKPAQASKGGGLDFADQKSGQPLEVYADKGLELSQDAKSVIGRGNAKAIRGRVTVKGDVLIAHYRDKQVPAGQPAPAKPEKTSGGQGGQADMAGSGSEVWRVEADGHVSIATETESAFGDHADYNIDDAVVVLTGKGLKLVTPTDLVTARDSLEYWEQRQQAVARGNAVATRGEKKIQADILVADFGENEEKQMAMQRAHAYDHVVLTTEREVVTGDRADYNVETGIVTVSGSVKIIRDKNELNGGYAVVNLNTGISRLFPTAPGVGEAVGGDQRVKGVFVPQKKNAGAAPGASAPAAGSGTATPPAGGEQPTKAP